MIININMLSNKYNLIDSNTQTTVDTLYTNYIFYCLAVFVRYIKITELNISNWSPLFKTNNKLKFYGNIINTTNNLIIASLEYCFNPDTIQFSVNSAGIRNKFLSQDLLVKLPSLCLNRLKTIHKLLNLQ